MSNRLVDTPEIEAKEIFSNVIEGEAFLFEYFFEFNKPPDGVSEEDYMRDLREEYLKLKREEAKILLGLDNK